MPLHIAMIVAGIAAIFWGLPASHRLRGLLGVLAALVTMTGLVVALLGVLLLAVPAFFQE